jgi:hypothetical protein
MDNIPESMSQQQAFSKRVSKMEILYYHFIHLYLWAVIIMVMMMINTNALCYSNDSEPKNNNNNRKRKLHRTKNHHRSLKRFVSTE